MNSHAAQSAMVRALELASRGPRVDPNPRVGSVILDATGVIVGEGFHAGAGTAHAEVNALNQAGERARGGIAVVTLEPCAHTGRTPPCATALIDAGVARVVFAQADPNPLAAGGANTLRAAGIEVTAGVLANEAAALNPDWTFAVTHGRPRVTWKYASTLDGFSAAADGSSQWITSAAARADVHDGRAECAAIMVGTGTVLADDPALTVRYPDGSLRERQPLRVVVGRREIPAAARVRDDSAPTLHLRTHNPAEVLAELTARGINHVWLEGGPQLAAAFLNAELIDRVLAYLAPALLGTGRSAVADLGIGSIGQARRLHLHQVARVGPDVRLELAAHPPLHPAKEAS